MLRERAVVLRGSGVSVDHRAIIEGPLSGGQKKIATSESKNRVGAFSHVKTEFKYESGMVELGLDGLLGASRAFFADFNFQ